MSDLSCSIIFPLSKNPPAEVTISSESTFEAIYARALQLFPEFERKLKFEILISLIDETYQFVDLSKPISSYIVPEHPKIFIVPPKYDIHFTYQADVDQSTGKVCPQLKEGHQDFIMSVNARESVESVLTRICQIHTKLTPDTFVLRDQNVTLIRPMSITEQNPGCKELIIRDSSSQAVKTPFVDLYLHGPVFLPLSDAIHLSAFLLQSEKGPSRHFKGAISSLNSFLPERFSGTPGVAEDLHMEWCFLHDTPRSIATNKFVESVQRLPLFNAISFVCEWKDTTFSQTKGFELIYTSTRLIFLDNTAFKMRLSIPFDDVLSIQYDDDTITLSYTPDGETESEMEFIADTPSALFFQTVSSIKGPDESLKLQTENYSLSTIVFKTLDQIREPIKNNDSEDSDSTQFYSIPRFPANFIQDFVKMNETGQIDVSTAELNHAILIRASACAFHLSVLLKQVTTNNAKSLQREIGAYYSRLMTYLTYLIYDHRPYDRAYPMRNLMKTLGEEETNEKVQEIIRSVIENLDLANQAFEPLSTDPLYRSSHEVVAYSLAHLISYKELPYAVADPNVEAFQELTDSFLKNALELKDLVSTYIFSVGDIELKTDLQKRLDLVFKNHLESLTLIQLITSNSEFSDIDPSVILHQDSCNIMVTAMVRFSSLLWADRTKLTDDQLSSFLSQAAELTKHIIKEPANKVIIRAIKDFSLVLNSNLPILVSTYKMNFGIVNAHISSLLAAVDLQPNINMHTKIKLLQVAASLIVVQPTVLLEEAKLLVQLMKDMCIDIHASTVYDITLFDFLPTEGKNNDLCSLRCHVIRVLGHPSSKNPRDLWEDLLPLFALEHMLKRSISEWSSEFINIFTALISLLSSMAISCVWKNPEVHKLSNSINEYGSIIPQLQLISDHKLSSLSLSDSENQVVQFCEKTLPQFMWKVNGEKLNLHEEIKILINALVEASLYTFNSLSMYLRSNTPKAFSSFTQCSITIQMLLDSLHLIMHKPSYFSAPVYWLQLQSKIEAVNQATNSYYSSNSLSVSSINAFSSLFQLISSIDFMTIDTPLVSLWPLDVTIIPPKKELDEIASSKEDHLDMTELMADYRIAKNDLLEVIALRERDMINPLVKSIYIAIMRMDKLVKEIDPKSSNDHFQIRFEIFCKVLVRVWSYALNRNHLKHEIWEIDLAVDEAVETIGNAMFDIPSAEKISELEKILISKSNSINEKYSNFVKNFIEILHKSTDIPPEIQFEFLHLIRDNKMNEISKLVKSFPSSSLESFIKEDPYLKAVCNWETLYSIVEDSNIFIWFKLGLKNFLNELKFGSNSNLENNGFKELVNKIDITFVGSIDTLPIVNENIRKAIGINPSSSALKILKENAEKASSYLSQLKTKCQECQNVILRDEEFSGNSLLYKNAMQQILQSFYAEYSLQLWDISPLTTLIKYIVSPLIEGFNSSAIADVLLQSRRLLRKLRLTERTAQTSFTVETEKMINKLEAELNKAFSGSEHKNEERLERQRTVIDSYIERLGKLRGGQTKKFIVRLMQNFALDLSAFNTFEADQLSHSIIRLFDEMNSAADNRTQEIKTLISWLEQMEPGLLPLDQKKVIEMLKELLKRGSVNEEDESMYILSQGAIVDIAISLSEALAHLANIRTILLLIKDSHRLFRLKDTMTTFIMGIIRALEAYADEIHTFPCNTHPVLGITKSVHEMCTALSNLFEAGFLHDVKIGSLADEAADQVEKFLKSCHEDLKESMNRIAEEPLKILRDIANENSQ